MRGGGGGNGATLASQSRPPYYFAEGKCYNKLMKKNIHLWLIRIYALIIVIVFFGGLLEGGALNLVIALASALILIQSLFVKTQ